MDNGKLGKLYVIISHHRRRTVYLKSADGGCVFQTANTFFNIYIYIGFLKTPASDSSHPTKLFQAEKSESVLDVVGRVQGDAAPTEASL